MHWNARLTENTATRIKALKTFKFPLLRATYAQNGTHRWLAGVLASTMPLGAAPLSRDGLSCRFTPMVRRRSACSLMKPAASFWSYRPPSSSNDAIRSSYRLKGDLRPTMMVFPCIAQHPITLELRRWRGTQERPDSSTWPCGLCCTENLPLLTSAAPDTQQVNRRAGKQANV